MALINTDGPTWVWASVLIIFDGFIFFSIVKICASVANYY